MAINYSTCHLSFAVLVSRHFVDCSWAHFEAGIAWRKQWSFPSAQVCDMILIDA